MYGLSKVYKAIVDLCLAFRATLSAIETPTYKIAEFLVPILNCLKINEFTVKILSRLPRKLLNQRIVYLWVALMWILSLFTNILLKQTITICIESICNQNDTVEGLSKSEFKNFCL